MGLSNWAKRLWSSSQGASEAPPAAEPTAQASTDAHAQASRAMELIHAGDFAGAARALGEVLRLRGDDDAARLNLAFCLDALGRVGESMTQLRHVLGRDPNSFDAHYMLAGALERAGRPAESVDHLRRAVQLRPEFAAARIDLCRTLAASGRADEAKQAILDGLAQQPDNADFHHYRGNLEMAAGDAKAAMACYERALSLHPGYAEVLANLGLAHQALGDLDLALARFDEALALAPQIANVHLNRGLVLKLRGNVAESELALRRALEIEPDNAETLNQFGVVLQQQGKLAAAADQYRRAITLRPDLPGAYGNLGLTLFELDRVPEAIDMYRRGLAVRPLATTHDNLGIALQRVGAIDEAIEQYQMALAIDPDNLNTRCNLGAALADGRGPLPAIAAYRDILAIKPDHIVTHSNLLFNLSYDGTTTPEEYLVEARRLEEKLSREVLPRLPLGTRPRPLRVGFVSGDLRGHPVGYFLEGVIDGMDHERFELFAYSTSPTEDALTQRLKRKFSGWRLIKMLTDEQSARAIRDDRIDVLVDLAGHTGLNRLPVFAWRPAPVQVSWLGYFASTGLRCMDFILADPWCVPVGTESAFTEQVWRLPDTRLCFTPPADDAAPVVADLPALANGYVTFGCFQRMPKVNDKVMALWGRVFERMPTARLLLKSQQLARPSFVEQTLARLAEVGISANRVIAQPPSGRLDYLAAHAKVDIILDTFPYTGGTTTCEALWMGVPTLTLAGRSMLERQGVAMMSSAGLPDWVAQTPDEYVDKAVEFAMATDELARLRRRLREHVRGSPMFDTRRFVAHFQDALEGMWDSVKARQESSLSGS